MLELLRLVMVVQRGIGGGAVLVAEAVGWAATVGGENSLENGACDGGIGGRGAIGEE